MVNPVQPTQPMYPVSGVVDGALGENQPGFGIPSQGKKVPVGVWIGGAVGAAVVIGLIIFAVTRVVTPSTTTVTVSLSVFTDDFAGCDLGVGYFDVPGSSVIVRADGQIVGTGALDRFGTEDVISCTFSARITDVPSDGDRYTFEIGRRGTGDATRAELERNDWTYEASLGL